MENLVTLLICLPFVMALILWLIKNEKVRKYVVFTFGITLAVLAIIVATAWFQVGKTMMFDLPRIELFNKIVIFSDFVLMFFIVYQGVKHKRYALCLLSAIQTLPLTYVELFGPQLPETPHIRLDWLSMIMILIIGVIGVAVGIYAVGYMKGFCAHHSEFRDRRRFFFAVIFMFYGAMFGLVLTMNVIWLCVFWEITSLCSFLLIGYTKTEEAINNSFRALWMNVLGGTGISFAAIYFIYMEGTLSLFEITALGDQGIGLVAIALLAFAALVKSGQFPFSTWVLGAMVAPTPSSALLHSATMVKAGVYLLLRISTAMSGNYVGQMVSLIGAFSFLMASVIAISTSHAKKVLAYSTISNLGLITACAGAGYEETVWAAIFLLIFHAVSKSMLFQCVGAIENNTGSKNIDNMEGLAIRYPKLAFILMVGIAGMFLAPFGMLISKWAALKAFVMAPDAMMILFIAFGSATTMFYWTKWLAKILGSTHEKEKKDITRRSEYASMYFHAFLLIVLCVGFPLISRHVIEPMMDYMYGVTGAVISEGNMVIMVIMILALFIVPSFNYLWTRKIKDKTVLTYMGGANAGDNKHFIDSYGDERELHVSNWYMMDWFGEQKLLKPSIWFSSVILVIFLCVIIGGAVR